METPRVMPTMVSRCFWLMDATFLRVSGLPPRACTEAVSRLNMSAMLRCIHVMTVACFDGGSRVVHPA